MKAETKGKLYIILSISCLLIAAIGVTYAYFVANLNRNTGNITVTTSELVGLTVTQTSALSLDDAMPGMSSTGQFTVANNKNKATRQQYNLYLVIDTNTFTSVSDAKNTDPVSGPKTDPTKQLILTVAQSSNARNFDATTSALVTKTINGGVATYTNDTLCDGTTYGATTRILIAENQIIAVGETQTYNTTLLYDNLKIRQNNNNGAEFTAHFEVTNVLSTTDAIGASEILAHLGLTLRSDSPDFTKMAPTASSYATTLGSVETTNVTDTNYYTYGTSVDINQTTGTYTLSGTGVCQFSSCYSSLVGKYVVAKEGANSSSQATTSNITDLFYVTEATSSTIKTKQVNVTITYDTTGIEDGIFETIDDYGVSYYFRGDVTNNYVKFGKNANNQDMYWRIIRINGDGSIRMIYDGTQAYANGTNNLARLAKTGVAWNSTNYKDAKFVGYMYGGTNTDKSSTYYQPDMTVTTGDYPYASSNNAVYNETNTNIKTQLENWYETNIKNTGYSQYIADRVFCNDRSKTSGPGYNATATTIYGAYSRNVSNKNPSLICSQKNDRFTVGDSGEANTGNDDTQGIGNGYLKYPVGLITADEVALAGGRWYMSNGASNNRKYYLYKGSSYWAFSPSYSDIITAYVFHVGSPGRLYFTNVNNGGGLAPVINLASEYGMTLSGTGTAGDPFKL